MLNDEEKRPAAKTYYFLTFILIHEAYFSIRLLDKLAPNSCNHHPPFLFLYMLDAIISPWVILSEFVMRLVEATSGRIYLVLKHDY